LLSNQHTANNPPSLIGDGFQSLSIRDVAYGQLICQISKEKEETIYSGIRWAFVIAKQLVDRFES
jgi:hypothetical protein